MAYRSKSGFSLHHYITAFVILLAAIGIALTVYASQQKTNTESDAAAGCAKDPILSLVDKNSSPRKTLYVLKIRSRDNSLGERGCKEDAYRISVDMPARWENWFYKIDSMGRSGNTTSIGFVTIQEGDSKTFELDVMPNDNAPSKEYYLQLRAVNKRNENAADTLWLRYIVN